MAEIRSAVRALRIFETFAEAGEALSLSHLAQRLDIPVSSCHGLINTLKSMGYVYAIGGRRFYPTRKCLHLAQTIADHDPLVELLRPILRELRDRSAETVLLAKRQDDAMVLLDVLESPQPIRYVAAAGSLMPLHSSAAGKALLGTLDDDALLLLLDRLELAPITERTHFQPAILANEIRQGRARGYHLGLGEHVPDVAGLAAIADFAGDTLVIALEGPVHRITRDIDGLADQLLWSRDRVQALS